MDKDIRAETLKYIDIGIGHRFIHSWQARCFGKLLKNIKTIHIIYLTSLQQNLQRKHSAAMLISNSL